MEEMEEEEEEDACCCAGQGMHQQLVDKGRVEEGQDNDENDALCCDEDHDESHDENDENDGHRYRLGEQQQLRRRQRDQQA